MFVPTEEDCPLPLKYLDILRKTETDLEAYAQREIDDFWTDDNASRELTDAWTGRVKFTILRPTPPAGKEWQDGRLTRVQATTRPESVWVETWESMSKKGRKKAIEQWKEEKPRRDSERRRSAKLDHIPFEEIDEFEKCLADAKQAHSIPAAPAMPTLPYSGISCSTEQSVAEGCKSRRQVLKHKEKIASAGFTSEEFFGLIHTPIPLPKALKNDRAKAALDKEWAKLEDPSRPAWDVNKVQPRAAVKARAIDETILEN